MFKYQIPDSPTPDYMVVLDAIQAECFLNASNSAMAVLSMMMLDQCALGVLRSRTAYLTGQLDLDKATIIGAKSVDSFGSDYLIDTQRAIIRNYRQYLHGHVRQAMNTTLAALGRTTLKLVFFSGGALFLVPPKEADGKHRVALTRFEGAKDMATERKCVLANQLCKEAYESLWTVLAGKQKQAADLDPSSDALAPDDVLDKPLTAARAAHQSEQGHTNELHAQDLPNPTAPPGSTSDPSDPYDIENTGELPF